MLRAYGLGEEALPIVVLPDHRVLKNPSIAGIADELGISEEVDSEKLHDVVVVGAGPAGLAAAVYAASEGLETVVIESLAPGGQRGPRPRSRTTSASPPASRARRWPRAPGPRRRSSAPSSSSAAPSPGWTAARTPTGCGSRTGAPSRPGR
jgi:hypothetical protein